MKKFSIITVCLNEQRLERTCQSIVNQIFQNFEWIVIDGGSNKEIQSIFEKYRYRMDYWVSEKDGGVYEAMNKGIAQASGEWLNFLNAGDCYVNQDVLSTVNTYTYLFNDIDVLHGKNETQRVLSYSTDDIVMNKYAWMNGNRIPHQAAFYKYSLFKIFGAYRTDYRVASDYAFNVNLFLNQCKFKHIDCYIASYDEYGMSSTPDPLSINEQQQVIDHFFTKKEISMSLKYKLELLKVNRMNFLRNKIKKDDKKTHSVF